MSLKQNLFYFTLIFSHVWKEYEQGKGETFTDQEQPWGCPAGELPILQSSAGLLEVAAATLFCCYS